MLGAAPEDLGEHGETPGPPLGPLGRVKRPYALPARWFVVGVLMKTHALVTPTREAVTNTPSALFPLKP